MTTQTQKTNTSTKKAAPTKAVEKTTKKAAVQRTIVNRDLIYRYPRGCNDPLKRKAFRQKIRRKINKMESDVSKLRGEDRRIMKAKLVAFKEEKMVV
jgi:hypothetical protein